MSGTRVIRGNAAQANASVQDGWVMGQFMPGGIAKTDRVEVKLWHYPEQPEYPVKVFNGIEFIVIYGGKLRIRTVVDGIEKDEVLSGAAHEYIILPPHAKQVFVEEAPAFGVTVRWKDPLMYAGEYTP